MELWTAFLLGLVGSLHCAGMCGPLALTIPANGKSSTTFLLGRLAYNSGRILTYGVLGAVFGLVGKSLALVGLQRWVSLGAGATILIALLFSTRLAMSVRLARGVSLLKSGLGKLLQQRTYRATFTLGLLNGLLPCGLVYAACAAATASSGLLAGTSYMAAFGLGTIPMMLGVSLAGKKLQFALRFKFGRLIPITLVIVGTLLVFRGLSLGIPYLSPDLAAGNCCHR